MGDFNLALVIIAAVVCVVVFLFNIYLLINYQHPDDLNQAYFPKLVVVLGLSVAEISILMLPADVANRQACSNNIYNGACNLTLPMKDLWLAVYIIDVVLVFFVIPFAMFYYEGDQDKSCGKRVFSALMWVIVTAVVFGLTLGILYGLVGKVDFTVRRLSSSTTNFPSSWSSLSLSKNHPCLAGTNGNTNLCDAYTAGASSETTWTMRTTFPEYVVALATIVGSVLFFYIWWSRYYLFTFGSYLLLSSSTKSYHYSCTLYQGGHRIRETSKRGKRGSCCTSTRREKW